MFLEKSNKSYKNGSIEVICGSMFSGKTEELIRRLKRAHLAKQKIEIYKPTLDKRFHDNKVVTHQGNEIHCTPVPSSANILILANDIDVIGIDEAQFFDDQLPDVCKQLANRGIRVIVAGLDMDYMGNPFGPIPHLMAIAEYVTKVHAICMNCGNLAYLSYRKSNEKNIVLLGELDNYEPLCRNCYNINYKK